MKIDLSSMFGKPLEVPEFGWEGKCVVSGCLNEPVVLAHVNWIGDPLDEKDVQYCENCWKGWQNMHKNGVPMVTLRRRRK
jgi:hypothetical protein